MLTRPAVSSDVPAIVELYNAILDTTSEYTEAPHTREERSSWLAAQRRAGLPVLVADDVATVVGVISYGPFRDNRRWPGYRFTAEHTIHVERSRQRSGVGRALMEALVERAREAGIRVLVAAIDASNEGSILFHARCGFVETGRMPGVGEKWGRRLELVLMQRELAASRCRQG